MTAALAHPKNLSEAVAALNARGIASGHIVKAIVDLHARHPNEDSEFAAGFVLHHAATSSDIEAGVSRRAAATSVQKSWAKAIAEANKRR